MEATASLAEPTLAQPSLSRPVASSWSSAPAPEETTGPPGAQPPPSREPPAPSKQTKKPGLRVRASWAQELLEADGDTRALARRGALGLGLAAIYGAALGTRDGGWSLLTHAAGVPAALLVVGLIGLPSLYIVLALFDAPLSMKAAAGAAVRGIASSGLVLAGLAPLTTLYVVTSTSARAAAIAGTLGLVLGGLLGLRHLVVTLGEALAEADSATRLFAMLAQGAFSVFAIVLGWRIWASLLPLVGGA